MGKTVLKEGMLYPVLTKQLYNKHMKDGMTVRRLRSKYGLSAEDLDTWIKENIVKPKAKGLTKERYVELKKKAWTDKQIREKFNIFPRDLADWKRASFTADEIEELNLRKKKEKVVKVATKTETKVNTFEREYHATIKEVGKLQEQNKRLSLSAGNLKKDCEVLKERLKAANEENESLQSTADNFSKENNKLIDKVTTLYAEKNSIKRNLEDEILNLKNEIVKQDYEIQNLNKNYSDVVSDLDELVKENNALKTLVKLWS